MDLDIAACFPPRLLGTALARVWTLDGQQLVPTMDALGVEVCCPITLQSMHDPALLADGTVYEHDAIAHWLRDHTRAPCTNVPLPHKHLLRLAPLAEALQLFMALRAGAVEQDEASLPARLRRASAAAEAALLREQQRKPVAGEEAKEDEDDGLASSGPGSQRALLEALEMCTAEGDAEVLQYQASLSRARKVVKEIHHELAASRFEANVKELLVSSRWAERKAAKADQAAVKAERAAAEKDAQATAARHEAAARIQYSWRLARRWRARKAMRLRLRQSRLHIRIPLSNKLSAGGECPHRRSKLLAAPIPSATSGLNSGSGVRPDQLHRLEQEQSCMMYRNTAASEAANADRGFRLR